MPFATGVACPRIMHMLWFNLNLVQSDLFLCFYIHYHRLISVLCKSYYYDIITIHWNKGEHQIVQREETNHNIHVRSRY